MTYYEMMTLLAIMSARAEAIIPDGCNHTTAYTLYGPRGNKTVVLVNACGVIDDRAVKLWIEGIAYGDARMLDRKPKARKTGKVS